MIMTQRTLPFQYRAEKNNSGLTGFAGLPLYVELAYKSGLVQAIEDNLDIKLRGWADFEVILSLILLNIAGGDCISDIERLEADAGLRKLLLQFSTHGMKRQEKRAYEKRWRKAKSRALPSNAAIHRYLGFFHCIEEEKKRLAGTAFIPKMNERLKSLIKINQVLVGSAQRQLPQTQATLDQDATLTETHKRNALYCYKRYKAYQPFNTYWAEHGLVVHSEFRDGNVPAGFEQLRVLKEALELLPSNVTKVFLRSDSAGYQEELLQYCAEGKHPRFGVIEFAIAARVSAAFKAAVSELEPSAWRPLYQQEPNGTRIQTNQEWAEVCFVPPWAGKSKRQAAYRYLAIREAMTNTPSKGEIETLDWPFQTIQENKINYKLFAMVTNRDLEGNALIKWHRERCGKSEQAHSIQKEGLAGGQLPSNKFGVNAAWWQIMVLAFNLNRLMQLAALPDNLKESRMKALRFHIIQRPGRVIYHAKQWCIRVESHVYALYKAVRAQLSKLTPCLTSLKVNTS